MLASFGCAASLPAVLLMAAGGVLSPSASGVQAEEHMLMA
jgi:hypothetical protein